ncbi:hypothetical protein C3L56_00035 [Veillonellaceae bacterium M2-4]|nr:hypothetical protein [Veillonellaceae bacterium M2-4]
MKKRISFMLMGIVTCVSMLLAGCGQGDSYAGTWVGYYAAKPHVIYITKIQKQEKGYLISVEDAYWQKNAAGQFVWKNDILPTVTGSIVQGRLVVDHKLNLVSYTYRDENDVLIYSNRTSNAVILFHKIKKNEIEEFKAKMKTSASAP